VDPLGVPHALFWRPSTTVNGRDLMLKEGSLAAQSIHFEPYDGSDFEEVSLAVHADAQGTKPVALYVRSDGLHTIAAAMDRVVPLTSPATPMGCPTFGCSPIDGCTDGATCAETGDGSRRGAQALARTADGRIFLVYAHRHIDRDRMVKSVCGEAGCSWYTS